MQIRITDSGTTQTIPVFETEETKQKRKRLRQIVGCELLLARLFRHHPDHAMAMLKGIAPHVVEIEPAEPPKVMPLPVESMDAVIGKRPTTTEIIVTVCEFYKITPLELCSRRRHYRTTLPRQIAMYLARMLTFSSFPTIGRMLGDRDHSTCMHGWRKVEQLIKTDPVMADDIDVLRLRIAERVLNKAAA